MAARRPPAPDMSNLPTQPGRRERAFSLVELVVVLAILAVLAAAAMGRYGTTLGRYRATAAARRVAQDLSLAQTVAKATGAGQAVAFNVNGNSYSLPGYAGPLNGPAQATYTVSLAADPYVATLRSVSFAGGTLTYDRFGQPSAGGTVVVVVGSTMTRTITVDANTGKASVQ